jgi:mRNA interferase RelE/StbE
MQVLKAIQKVSANPLPNTEGGLGKPLGSHLTSKLTGYLKIKLQKLGIRVVYRLIRNQNTMRIIIISVRDDDTVYRMAQERLKK